MRRRSRIARAPRCSVCGWRESGGVKLGNSRNQLIQRGHDDSACSVRQSCSMKQVGRVSLSGNDVAVGNCDCQSVGVVDVVGRPTRLWIPMSGCEQSYPDISGRHRVGESSASLSRVSIRGTRSPRSSTPISVRCKKSLALAVEDLAEMHADTRSELLVAHFSSAPSAARAQSALTITR
jgi:hypothetical protein